MLIDQRPFHRSQLLRTSPQGEVFLFFLVEKDFFIHYIFITVSPLQSSPRSFAHPFSPNFTPLLSLSLENRGKKKHK